MNEAQIVKAVHEACATGRVALTHINNDGVEVPTDVAKCFVRALSALSHLEQEPNAWMWQHDETGNVGFVEAMDDENLRIWKVLNRHLRIVKPLYAHPCASGKDAELLQAAKAFAQAHIDCDEMEARDECGDDCPTDLEYEAKTAAYNATKAALVNAYRAALTASSEATAPQDAQERDRIVESIVSDVCEMDPADQNLNGTICIDVSDLITIVKRHVDALNTTQPADANLRLADQPEITCKSCGADRTKEDCKGDRANCSLRGTAYVAEGKAEQQGDKQTMIEPCGCSPDKRMRCDYCAGYGKGGPQGDNNE